jgi:predicted kinase
MFMHACYDTCMTHCPSLIIVSGPPGAGKSTLALQLSAVLPCPLISRDAIRAGLTLGATLTPDHASVNRLFQSSVTQLLSHGCAVICEAAFRHTVWQSLLSDWQACARIVVVSCHIDANTALQRMTTRLQQQPWRAHIHDDQTYIDQLHQNPSLIDDFGYLTINAPTYQLDMTTLVDLPLLTDWVRANTE